MLWLKPYIAKIEEHIEAGTPARLTYAALECRLALERICYERLRISYDYVSQKDFARRWTPKQVIDFLLAEGNDQATQEFTLSISKEPVAEPTTAMTADDFKSTEWVVVGKQVGFDAKRVHHLWQSLSSFLHVRMPRSRDDELASYGDVTAMTEKLHSAVAELKRLSDGTLISSGMGDTVSFECRCGMTNKRRERLLNNSAILSCSNPSCDERYRVHKDLAGDCTFERLVVSITCRHCGEVGHFGENEVIRIGLNKVAAYSCGECGGLNRISWRLMQASSD